MSHFFIFLNIFFWVLIFLVQSYEGYKQLIPKRRPGNRANSSESFLYIQDWHTGSWGDLIGLSLTSFAFGEVLNSRENCFFIIAFSLSILITLCLHLIWKKGQPNAGYPFKGKMSYSGKLHLVYSMMHVYMISYLLLMLIFKEVGLQIMIVTGIGVMIYLFSFYFDYKLGKFEF